MKLPKLNYQSPMITIIASFLVGGTFNYYNNHRAYQFNQSIIKETFEKHKISHEIDPEYLEQDLTWMKEQLSHQETWKGKNPLYKAVFWPPIPSYDGLL